MSLVHGTDTNRKELKRFRIKLRKEVKSITDIQTNKIAGYLGNIDIIAYWTFLTKPRGICWNTNAEKIYFKLREYLGY